MKPKRLENDFAVLSFNPVTPRTSVGLPSHVRRAHAAGDGVFESHQFRFVKGSAQQKTSSSQPA